MGLWVLVEAWWVFGGWVGLVGQAAGGLERQAGGDRSRCGWEGGAVVCWGCWKGCSGAEGVLRGC